MGILDNKRILVTGLLSNRSIAYGVARAAQRQGATLAFTFQNERFRERVTDMAAELGSSLIFPCDVANDEEIAALAFSKESKQGRMLMARVRTLIKENEEFGAQVSEGRLHALETQVEMLKAHVTQLKREHAEMTATAQALAAENEALQLRALGRPPNGEAGPSAAAGDDHFRGGGGASAMDADAAVHAPDAPAAAPAPDGGDKGNGQEEEAPAERPAKRTRGARK